MASNLAFATRDDIEEDLLFNEVLISSLDVGAVDYKQRYEELAAKRQELEDALSNMHSGAFPQDNHLTTPTMNGGPREATWASRPGSSSGTDGSAIFDDLDAPAAFDAVSNSRHASKRPLPVQPHYERPTKRRTPDRSMNNTPPLNSLPHEKTSSSADLVAQRARQRQAEAVAEMRKRQQARLADEMYARTLDHGDSGSSSERTLDSSGPRVQTTLKSNGSYHRPSPRVQNASVPPTSYHTKPTVPTSSNLARNRPLIKSEANERKIIPGPPMAPHQLTQRPRQSIPVVDLTGDSDEEDLTSMDRQGTRPLVSQNFDGRQNREVGPIPGAYPSYVVNPEYGNHDVLAAGRRLPWSQSTAMGNSSSSRNISNDLGNHQANGWGVPAWQPPPSSFSSAINGIRTAAGTIGNSLSGLNRLINGSRGNPFWLGDDDDDDDDEDNDIMFTGSHALPPGHPLYRGHDDLYRRRYDEILENDPAKTREEINALLDNIRPDEDLPEHLRVQTPDALSIRLHKYQEVGLSWLQNCERGSNMGGILADDMGLGKTIQVLSLLVTHKSDDPRCKTTLIVAPVALMRQWKQEIQEKVKRSSQHALTVYIHHGPSKKKSFRDLQHYDVVLTTFGSVATEAKKMEGYVFRKRTNPDARPRPNEQCVLLGEDSKWYRCVLDEAQCIRNKGTQTARGACMIDAKYRFCVTGTPMMNNLGELYSLLKFLRIAPYNKWEKFRLDFVTPMKSAPDSFREAAMRKLQALCKAVMLRRTKKSTFEGRPILVLPDRTTEPENPTFSEDERAFYDAIESKTQLEFNRYVERGQVGSKYSAILVILLRLRQACCHPHLIKDFGVSAAADVSPEDLVEFAKQLDDSVVARIKETGGNFECPVCYDATPNPAIFLPCGHETCAECLAKIADPANAINSGDENGTVRCPTCRGSIDPKRVTDFNAFKSIHMPELLAAEGLGPFGGTTELDESDSDDDDDDEDSDDEEEVDRKGNLKDFIVDDEAEESEDNSQAEEDDEVKREIKGEVKDEIEDESVPGPSNAASLENKKAKDKGKKDKKKSKKKGKKKAEVVTLAELKKQSTRNAKAKKKYLRRLRKDWISSAKIEKTLELLQTIIADEEGEKVLIFSQWTSLLDLLEVPIDEAGWGYRRYDGSMSTRMRNDAVDDFRDARKNVRIMLVSLKAGNAGLNLNMASQVIILDPFWNPFIEEQAIDRAHRIGQTRPVKVHRMLIPETVEDRIINLQEQKRQLIGEALDEKASQNIARLGVQELAYLFGVTRDPTQRVAYTAANAR